MIIWQMLLPIENRSGIKEDMSQTHALFFIAARMSICKVF